MPTVRSSDVNWNSMAERRRPTAPFSVQRPKRQHHGRKGTVGPVNHRSLLLVGVAARCPGVRSASLKGDAGRLTS